MLVGISCGSEVWYLSSHPTAPRESLGDIAVASGKSCVSISGIEARYGWAAWSGNEGNRILTCRWFRGIMSLLFLGVVQGMNEVFLTMFVMLLFLLGVTTK